MAATAPIVGQQFPGSAPNVEGTVEVTNPLLIPVRTADRLAHFPDNVYTLTADSHLVRLLKVLLGDAGIGGVRKRFMFSRFQQTLNGSHFIDLDRFYGALFGLRRRSYEVLTSDPAGVATSEEWDEMHQRDAAYRSRIEQFGRAIGFGATPTGMELAAEALLNIDCDIYESWVIADRSLKTWGDVETAVGTYGGAETFDYGELEATEIADSSPDNRYLFTVRPKRGITLEEKYDVQRVLSRLKPVFTRMLVDEAGIPIHRDAHIQDIAADSEYWEVRSQIIPSPAVQNIYSVISIDGSPISLPRPPFSQYQGESWSYNGDVTGVVGFSEDSIGGGGAIPGSDRTRVYYVKSHSPYVIGFLDYIPPNALQPLQNTEAGRVVSDGILVAHPLTARSNQTQESGEGTPVLPANPITLYSDSILLWQPWLDFHSSGWFNPSGVIGIWPTAERAQSDHTREIIELRYSTPRLVNFVAAEVSRFPHVLAIEVRSLVTGEWVRVFNTTIKDSKPKRLDGNTPSDDPTHPHHRDRNHWFSVRERIAATSTDRVRFIMTRTTFGKGPVNSKGQPVPYSLAIRKVDVGYRITGSKDMHKKHGVVIARTKDILGSTKLFTTHREPARNLLSGGQWRSEPMPVSDAVVNLYLDTRDENGNSQVIDRFYTDPSVVGPHLSLYWADVIPDTGGRALPPTPTTTQAIVDNPETKIIDSAFEPNDKTLPPSVVGGTVVVADDGIVFSDGGDSWLDFALEGTTWTPDNSTDWWIGLKFKLPSTWTADDDVQLAAWGDTTLHVDGGGTVTLATGMDEVASDMGSPPPPGATIGVVVTRTWDGNVTVICKLIDPLPVIHDDDEVDERFPRWWRHRKRWVSTTGSMTFADGPTNLRIGDADAAPKFKLLGLIAKQHRGVVDWIGIPEPVKSLPIFVVDTITYTHNGRWSEHELILTSNFHEDFFIEQSSVSDDNIAVIEEVVANHPSLFYQQLRDNAVIRFHPSFVDDENEYGFIGGTPNVFDEVEWNPVPRDYTLQKGYIKVPPTSAKLWKFEFTNLVSQPFESFVPIRRRVKKFPLRIVKESFLLAGISLQRPGLRTMRRLLSRGGVFLFTDSAQINTVLVNTSGKRVPTSAIYVQNYVMAQVISKKSHLYNFLPIGQGFQAAGFSVKGKHVYEVEVVDHSTKVGFFVGLKEIKAYRLEYGVDDDTVQYRDFFHDDTNIENPYTWELDPQRLFTDDVGLPSVATSKVFESHHEVQGLQFATQQNDPVQIVPDDEFRDPSLINYAWDDDGRWHSYGDALLNYNPDNTTVRVSRQAIDTPGSISGGADLGMEQPLPHPSFSLSIPDTDTPSTHLFGGLESPAIAISAEGRIHAAVRFTALTDLTYPVQLQIVNASGTVLASKEIFAKAGQLVEDFVSYTINSYVPHYASSPSMFTPVRTIVDVPFQPVTTDPELSVAGDPVIPDTTGDDQVKVRIVQYGETGDSWLLDALSLFDESILWEFTVDGGVTWYPAYGIRNFVNGVLTFPHPGTQLRWRVTGYRANMNITSLQIRPWYHNRLIVRTAGHYRGPNVSTFDHEPPIQDDPEFNLWDKPVPRTWFLIGKPFPLLPADPTAPQNEFSNFYGRSATESVSGLTSGATRQIVVDRYGYVVYDSGSLPHEVPGETVPTPGMTVSRTTVVTRTADESVDAPDEHVVVLLVAYEDPINRSPFSPPN